MVVDVCDYSLVVYVARVLQHRVQSCQVRSSCVSAELCEVQLLLVIQRVAVVRVLPRVQVTVSRSSVVLHVLKIIN